MSGCRGEAHEGKDYELGSKMRDAGKGGEGT